MSICTCMHAWPRWSRIGFLAQRAESRSSVAPMTLADFCCTFAYMPSTFFDDYSMLGISIVGPRSFKGRSTRACRSKLLLPLTATLFNSSHQHLPSHPSHKEYTILLPTPTPKIGQSLRGVIIYPPLLHAPVPAGPGIIITDVTCWVNWQSALTELISSVVP